VGAISYIKKGEVSAEAILNFALASVVTVFCMRKFIMPNLPAEFVVNGIEFSKQNLIMVVFALLILSASYSMIISRKPNRIKDVKWNEFTKTPLGFPFVSIIRRFNWRDHWFCWCWRWFYYCARTDDFCEIEF
jgi:uncharacterized membrane protein YfcA